MRFFEDRRRINTMIKKFTGKAMKISKTSIIPCVIIEAECTLTDEIFRQMPTNVQIVMGTPGDGESLAIVKTETYYEFEASLRMISPITGQVVLTRGYGEAAPVKVEVKKFYFEDAKRKMLLKISGAFDTPTWAWGGTVLGDGDLVMEIQPFIKELDQQPDFKSGEENGKQAA